ncbi:KEOPS complex subunit Pcc1 [Candidatus Harpocratesius sp.]
MRIFTEINLVFSSFENQDIFYKSFMPEFSSLNMKRSTWSVKTLPSTEPRLIFQIQADDATAFRATLNSLIQFASIVERTLKLTEKY